MSHHTTLFPVRDPHDERAHRRAANRALAFSAILLAAAGVIELVVASFTRSVGLLGDGLHNLSDVSTSALVFVGFAVSRRAATERFPRGFDRAEDLAGIGVALVIWASAGFAAWESWNKLVAHGTTDHLALGAAAAVVAMAVNRIVAAYKGRVGTEIQSATLLADARHSWLDAVSSLGALIGIIAVALGAPWGDPIAGFAVTLFIVHVGWDVSVDLVHHLMDGSDPDVAREAEAAALVIPDVEQATATSRWAGRSLIVDVEIGLQPAVSLADAEHIAEGVRLSVLHHLESARIVNVRPITTTSGGHTTGSS